MCSGTSIALIAALALSTAATTYAATRKPPSAKTSIPEAVAPEVPSGPATIPDKTNFAQERGLTPMQSPEGISFGGGLSNEQKRSQIATGALAGNTGLYKTPEVQRFYKDLAFRTLTDEAGNPAGQPLGIEKQYLSQVLGQTPQASSTASFLSALLRN